MLAMELFVAFYLLSAELPRRQIPANPKVLILVIGRGIELELQAPGHLILWMRCSPVDADFLDSLFSEEVRAGKIKSGFDISDVWSSSYSRNTHEILWAPKVAGRYPWITCVVRFSSYACGMDQPRYTPTQKTAEASGRLFFKFGDLDSTKPAGSIKIRIETIVHSLDQYSTHIMQRKLPAQSKQFQTMAIPPDGDSRERP